MTPKERAAMQQALEALENAYENGFLTGITGLKTIDTITALREALEQPVSQEPAGYFTYDGDYNIWEEVFSKETYGAVPLYAAPVKQAEQEPVATDWDKVQEIVCDVFSRCISSADGFHAIRDLVDTAPRPVKEVELTDDEINELWLTHGQGQMMYIHEKFARAVIAADRRKNK